MLKTLDFACIRKQLMDASVPLGHNRRESVVIHVDIFDIIAVDAVWVERPARRFSPSFRDRSTETVALIDLRQCESVKVNVIDLI